MQISALQEDRKASDRLMKSKELALVEAEKKMNGALERSLMVENLQNQNIELKRQVQICLVWLVGYYFSLNTYDLESLDFKYFKDCFCRRKINF